MNWLDFMYYRFRAFYEKYEKNTTSTYLDFSAVVLMTVFFNLLLISLDFIYEIIYGEKFLKNKYYTVVTAIIIFGILFYRYRYVKDNKEIEERVRELSDNQLVIYTLSVYGYCIATVLLTAYLIYQYGGKL